MRSVIRRAALQRLALAALLCGPCGLAASQDGREVAAGENWAVQGTTRLRQLQVAPGARIEAPAGKELTLTVNGVETALRPGRYAGNLVLTTSAPNVVDFSFAGSTISHHFRQALYVDAAGIDRGRSVLAAAGAFTESGGDFRGVTIKSVGENFNGVFVAGGRHTFANTTIDLTGNGEDDFAGYGAGFMVSGEGTTAILDHGRITTRGTVRSAVVATNGANLVVKNSRIDASDGVLPADYVPNVDPGKMRSVPWMLSLSGNNRATNLLGERTRATYIGSTVTAENWGVLSNDISSRATLTAINTTARIRGRSGYGAYSLGGATTQFYGSKLDVRDYGVIVDAGGSTIRFGASRPDVVARLNSELALGLTAAELKSLRVQQSSVKSDRFGLLMQSSPVIPDEMATRPDAKIEIGDGTVFDTGGAVFFDRDLAVHLVVDGSQGARLHSRKGIIFQVIETDDPGVVMQGGSMLSSGVYHEPAGAPVRAEGFDVATPSVRDVRAEFSDIALEGDFFNGFRDGTGGYGAGRKPTGKNLVLDFKRARLAGLITATSVRHARDTIGAADYRLLGEVSNTPSAAINNGVVVSLLRSNWTVTGTCYLTALSLDAESTIAGRRGAPVSMTVDGQPVAIRPGQYRGHIVLGPDAR
jgi:hypothetical protein